MSGAATDRVTDEQLEYGLEYFSPRPGFSPRSGSVLYEIAYRALHELKRLRASPEPAVARPLSVDDTSSLEAENDRLRAQLDELEKFYADGLHAWRENSRASAARIAELEDALCTANAYISLANMEVSEGLSLQGQLVLQEGRDMLKQPIADGGNKP